MHLSDRPALGKPAWTRRLVYPHPALGSLVAGDPLEQGATKTFTYQGQSRRSHPVEGIARTG